MSEGDRMKLTRVRVLTIGAAVLLLAANVIAQGPHGFGGPGGEFRGMLRQLDLTSDQKAQVKAIIEKEKPTLQPLLQQMQQNHAAMSTLQASGPFDEAKTTALATQNSQTMIQLEVEHERIKSEVLQILTADQKAKLAQIEANHAAHMNGAPATPPSAD
jgi:periplasmic protein CpxP/Spy